MQDMAVLMTMHPSDVVKDGSTEELQALVSPFKVMNTARTTLFLVIFCWNRQWLQPLLMLTWFTWLLNNILVKNFGPTQNVG